MNLELPFYQLPDDDLDQYLERIDAQLDTLFLEAVKERLEALRAEPEPAVRAPTAA